MATKQYHLDLSQYPCFEFVGSNTGSRAYAIAAGCVAGTPIESIAFSVTFIAAVNIGVVKTVATMHTSKQPGQH